jgi:hypothetical protein
VIVDCMSIQILVLEGFRILERTDCLGSIWIVDCSILSVVSSEGVRDPYVDMIFMV